METWNHSEAAHRVDAAGASHQALGMATITPQEFHARPAVMTTSEVHATALAELPAEPAALARVVQGLLLHLHFAPAYGISLTEVRRSESHIRSVSTMLECILARDARPLSEARPIDERLVGVCRHFSLLAVAVLRAHGIPARARCGFGAYFIPGQFEDHWVCEYWNAAERRWVLVDTQIDELQRSLLDVGFDLLDVPRHRFLVAGDAWALCRSGGADASKFGITDMRGLWFVAGNVLRDLAALNNMEMLPWDVWGPMTGPGASMTSDELALFDRLAALTREPDAHFAEMLSAYGGDDRLRVPAAVFNALLQRTEAV